MCCYVFEFWFLCSGFVMDNFDEFWGFGFVVKVLLLLMLEVLIVVVIYLCYYVVIVECICMFGG